MAMKIRAILEARTTSAEQDMLHKHDEDTTWFGIIREDAELPLLMVASYITLDSKIEGR